MRLVFCLFALLLLALPAPAQEIVQRRMVIQSSRPVAEVRDCILAHAPGAAVVHGRGAFVTLLYGASPHRGPDESWSLRITGDRRGSRLVAQTASRLSRTALRQAMEPCLAGGAR
jgi:hypothetical protein